MRLKASWVEFFRGLKKRGLRGVRLVIGDRRLGLVEAAREVVPEAKMQRCVAHFYRNVSSKVPSGKMKAVANSGRRPSTLWMSKKAAREKAASVVKKLTQP